MKNCPVCGAQIEDSSCTYCDYVVLQDEVKNKANVPIIVNNTIIVDNYNKNDNSSNLSRKTLVSEKGKLLAYLFALFLGPFGLHYFYIGDKKKGWTYLFTMGILGLGWMYDIITFPFRKVLDDQGAEVKW